MSNALYRLGRYCAANPWRIILSWFLAAALIIVLSSAFGRELEDSFNVPGLDSQEALDLLQSAQSDSAGQTAQVVVTPRDGSSFFTSPTASAELSALQGELAGLPKVLGVVDAAGALAAGPEIAAQSGVISPDGTVAVLTVQYPVLEELRVDDLEVLKEWRDEADQSSELQVEAGGDLFFSFEQPETGIGEMIGIIVAIVVLLVAFGSVIAMFLPIGMAGFGLALGITSMSLITYLIDIPSWAPQMGSMIGLGVGIDYALFVVTRHREFLGRGHTVEDSVGRAAATAGQAVIFAGGTVVVAILGLALAGIPFVTAAGVSTSVIVFIMVASSITLLPAFLGLAGERLAKFGFGRNRGDSSTLGALTGRWRRWGAHVTKNAWAYVIGVTAFLLLLTAPLLSLELGFPDAGTIPDSRTERRAYDLVADGFGPGINGPLLIAVDISQDPSVVEPLAAAVMADEGVAAIAPPQVDAASGVATILAFPTTSPQDAATSETIDRLRASAFPPVLSDSPATAHIGGGTASFGDIGGRVGERLPFFIGAVILLSFLLLMLVFRSILVPLKAAILNLLSIGAAYGVLVAVFQWGWGLSLIGLESTGPIVSFLPMFMFAILFGLSMDYEVFLLSRVREEYLATGDNDLSVISGLASTARVITSAALIMISVFLGFVLGDDPIIKMMGLGLATAIFVDATIVRIVLVPAMMKLMGDTNWWLPKSVGRFMPSIDIEGETALPAPEYVVIDATVDEDASAIRRVGVRQRGSS